MNCRIFQDSGRKWDGKNCGIEAGYTKSRIECLVNTPVCKPARLKKVKLADKPGSVVDSHSSRRFVT